MEELQGITRYDLYDEVNLSYLRSIALDVCSQWDGSDDNLTQRVCGALIDALGIIKEYLDLLEVLDEE